MIEGLIFVIWGAYFILLGLAIFGIILNLTLHIIDFIHYRKLDKDPNSDINRIRRYNCNCNEIHSTKREGGEK